MSLLHFPATEIARLVATGQLSAVEVIQAHLDRIARINPLLNAFVDVRADEALAEARAQDAAAASGAARGPLGGVPVTIKSAIEVAGVRCETGSPSRRGTIANRDAVVTSRLRAAGAIVLGTTNVAEMLMGYESENPLHGRTANPWALDRTAGGSSGGESAAIAAGCSAGGIGSDGGGSIRVPAHFTGICGLKPTPGRIPGTGHQPACLGPFSLIGVVGPMARTVGDLAAMFAAIAGWDPVDPMAVPLAAPFRAASGLAGLRRTASPPAMRGGAASPAESAARSSLPEAAALAGLRVGCFEDDGRVPVTSETRRAVQAAARAVADRGADVEPFRPSGLDRVRELWEIFFCEIALLVLQEPMGAAAGELPILKEFLKHRPRTPLTAASFTTAWIERDLARAELLRQMETHRILICPVASIPAFRHGERAWSVDGTEVHYLDAMSYTQWFNILGNPAAVVPVGRSDEGLPIGVQVVGRPFEEELVLAVAAAVEEGCGGYQRPPV